MIDDLTSESRRITDDIRINIIFATLFRENYQYTYQFSLLQDEVYQCHRPLHSSPCSHKCRSIKSLEPTPLRK